jgi:hypothetical protein
VSAVAQGEVPPEQVDGPKRERNGGGDALRKIGSNRQEISGLLAIVVILRCPA